MFSLSGWRYTVILLSLFFSLHVNATPAEVSKNEAEIRDVAPRALANGAVLRILCLGASITYGYESGDGNGYRYGLRSTLVSGGNKVNMIGSLTHGTMNNNQVEGWIGYRIAEVAQKAELSLPSLPNVVLIHAGTNDMAQNYQVSTAHLRMATLIDRIFQAVPGTSIIVSTLLPNADANTQANVLIFNKNLAGVVADRVASGKKIALVDMSSDWFSLADLEPDGTHPTDTGYLKMAKVFYNGIGGLSGQISPPQNVAGINDLAAKDDPNSNGILNAICQTVPGQPVPTAQQSLCGLTMGTTSPVAPSVSTTPVSPPKNAPLVGVVTSAPSSPSTVSTTPTPSPTVRTGAVAVTFAASSTSRVPSSTSPVPSSTSVRGSSIQSSISTSVVPSSKVPSNSSPSKATLSSSSGSSTSPSLILSLTATSISLLLTLAQSSVATSTTALHSSTVAPPSTTSSLVSSTTLISVAPSNSKTSAALSSPSPVLKSNSNQSKNINKYLLSALLLVGGLIYQI